MQFMWRIMFRKVFTTLIKRLYVRYFVKDTEMETLRLNVGGSIFETTRETINSLGDWKLADQEFLSSCYREKEGDYFFDRDPQVFKVVLNYLRTNKLHLPTTLCSPFIKEELEFWNINEHNIERCCWANYNRWNSSLEALARLERDRKAFSEGSHTSNDKDQTSFWSSHRAKVWRLLNRGTSSIGAKIFSAVSLTFVVVSIVTLVLSTTILFRDTGNTQQEGQQSNTNNPTTTDATNRTCATETVKYNVTSKKYYKNDFLDAVNILCLSYFLLEYVVRFAYSPRKIHFLRSFLSIIDVLALIPDIIEYVVFAIKPQIEDQLSGVAYVTILRVLRILRIFRLIRHFTGLWVVIYTLKASVKELFLLVWLLLIGVVFFASLIYIVEDKNDFKSIPDGFWWAIITMTTVGYGDMTPKTAWGKVIGSFCAMLGVLVIGFSVPFLVNNFMMFYSQLEFATMIEEKEKQKEHAREMKRTTNNTPDTVATTLC